MVARAGPHLGRASGRTRVTSADAITEITLLAATDAGMHALWNPSRFTGITDYETWESALLEDDDLTRRVQAGDLVPINIGFDGVRQFLVRSARETRSPRSPTAKGSTCSSPHSRTDTCPTAPPTSLASSTSPLTPAPTPRP